MQNSIADLATLIRDVPDFPKPGILFKDITPLLAHKSGLRLICDQLTSSYKSESVDKVLAIESRGFFLGAGVAERLQAGFVPVRKKGKLPWKTVSESYSLEYGEAALELHSDAIQPGERVVVIDDVLATGGTLAAVQGLVKRLGGTIVGFSCLIEIKALSGRAKLQAPVHSIWTV